MIVDFGEHDPNADGFWNGFPEGELCFRSLSCGDTIHQVPMEAFVHEVGAKGECLCGPWQVDGARPFYRHWPLDPRFTELGF